MACPSRSSRRARAHLCRRTAGCEPVLPLGHRPVLRNVSQTNIERVVLVLSMTISELFRLAE